jgi:hypothetical protein
VTFGGLEPWVASALGDHPVQLALLAGLFIATMNVAGALAIVP